MKKKTALEKTIDPVILKSEIDWLLEKNCMLLDIIDKIITTHADSGTLKNVAKKALQKIKD